MAPALPSQPRPLHRAARSLVIPHFNSHTLLCPGVSPCNTSPLIAILKHPHHVSIEKSWYSAFTETSLDETLQSCSITHVNIAGVTTSTCVAATSVHARRLGGTSVTIIGDLGFPLKPETSEKALDTLTAAPYNLSLCKTEQVPANFDTKSGAKLPELFYVNGSIPSRRVMVALSLKRIPYKATRLRVMTTPKETQSANFRVLNPCGKTPTFADVDGTVVIESLAILQYLEEYYSATQHGSLMPECSRRRE
jgi:hypothetical protein